MVSTLAVSVSLVGSTARAEGVGRVAAFSPYARSTTPSFVTDFEPQTCWEATCSNDDTFRISTITNRVGATASAPACVSDEIAQLTIEGTGFKTLDVKSSPGCQFAAAYSAVGGLRVRVESASNSPTAWIKLVTARARRTVVRKLRWSLTVVGPSARRGSSGSVTLRTRYTPGRKSKKGYIIRENAPNFAFDDKCLVDNAPAGFYLQISHRPYYCWYPGTRGLPARWTKTLAHDLSGLHLRTTSQNAGLAALADRVRVTTWSKGLIAIDHISNYGCVLSRASTLTNRIDDCKAGTINTTMTADATFVDYFGDEVTAAEGDTLTCGGTVRLRRPGWSPLAAYGSLSLLDDLPNEWCSIDELDL